MSLGFEVFCVAVLLVILISVIFTFCYVMKIHRRLQVTEFRKQVMEDPHRWTGLPGSGGADRSEGTPR